MSALSLKNIFHEGDFHGRFDLVSWAIMSLSLLIPLALFVFGIICLLACIIQNLLVS